MTQTGLRDRRALVTGGDSGIGQAIALGLAELGVEIVLHHFGQPDAAQKTADKILAAGGKVHVVSADFMHPKAATALIDDVINQIGGIDILIANAAMERRANWIALDAATVADHVQVNFTSLINLLQGVMPSMVERGWGRIVCIGSIMAERPRAETLTYAALKSAQLTAVRAIAREVAGAGVTINVVSPGAIETRRTADRYADANFRAAVVAKIPAGRPGRPADVVPPVLMLCSEGAAYITGTNIMVDGGWSIGDAPA